MIHPQFTLRAGRCALIVAVLAYVTAANGQGLTYVDADDFVSPNLSTSSGDPLGDAIDQFDLSTDIGNDGLWRFRGANSGNMFGASGTVYESDNGEDAQELIQTISGLNSGTSYDVYAVWWSATNDNWVLRAGLNSNPNGNTVYDRTGGAGTAGSLGVFTNWAQPPEDNLDIADGFTGVEAATVEGNRVMLVAKVGTTTASGSGEIPVYLDDAVGLAGAGRGWLDGVAYAPAGTQATGVSATVDRTTGNLTLSASSDYSITAVSIGSNAGALEPANWTPITGNLDSAGNSSLDIDPWEITDSSVTVLAENEVGPFDGGTIGPGGAASIDFGDVWVASPFEDMIINLTLADSEFTVPLTVEFTGGDAIGFGDFDADGDLDVDDYEVLLRGLNQPLGGLTDLESYALGDITGDQQANFDDLAAFRDLYDAANGAGSFNALVPEPNAALLLFMGFIAMAAGLRRRTRKVTMVSCCLLALTLICPSESQAQITYIDADEQAGGNTAGLPGGWVNRGAGGGEDGETRNFANEGGALQGNGAGDEINTTFSIPQAGVYQIYTFFWDDGANWNIQTGLNSGALTDFDTNSAGVFAINDETQMAGLSTVVSGLNVLGQDADTYEDWIDGNRTLYAAPAGITSVDAGGEVTVYVDHATGLAQRTWYDGVGWGEAQPTLTMEVNTTTGAVALRNDFDVPIDLSYYEITSPSGSLSRANWNSLDDQNLDAVDGSDAGSVAGDSLLEGWDEAGLDTDTTILNETFFLGQSSIAPGGSLSLGAAFTAGGAEDLALAFGLVSDGNLELGIVDYVTGSLNGDFNSDGAWNCSDIDALTAAIASGSNDLAFDMNGDGSVTFDDVTAAGTGWLAVAGSQNPAQTGGNSFQIADGNLDGVVDVSDFGIWNSNKFTNNDAWCSGDFNADGVVDVSDFGAWNSNKFTSASDAAAVPEPAGFGLAGISLMCIFALRRRHR